MEEEEEEEGRERGHAKGPPGRGERAGLSGGSKGGRGARRRRHGAHTLAHTRSHSTPVRSPPEGPCGGSRERCNLLATLGNCTGGRSPCPHALRAGPATLAPTAPARPRPGHGPRRSSPPLLPGRTGLLLAHPSHPQEKGEEEAGANLVSTG